MKRPANNVMSAVMTRQKLTKNQNIWVIHEDFELIFNAVFTSVIVIGGLFEA
jgi:hypothetical protein